MLSMVRVRLVLGLTRARNRYGYGQLGLEFGLARVRARLCLG